MSLALCIDCVQQNFFWQDIWSSSNSKFSRNKFCFFNWLALF